MSIAGDGTIQTRDEDSFDVDALHGWILRECPDLAGRDGRAPEVRQFAGGASNLTYLVRYPGDAGSPRECVLRRPPRGHKAASAHDMGREVSVQRLLRPHFPLVPAILGYCEDPGIVGSEFYLMERLDGTILRRDLPPGLRLSPEQARSLADTVIDAQADLHAFDPRAAGLDSLGRGPGYVARQVEGWSRRYRSTRTDDVPDAEDVMGWLEARRPPDVAERLIHGDWRFDNLVLDLSGPPRIVGVLDWEMATVGDPLMDVGSSLAYWVTADDDPAFQILRRQPTHLPGMPTRAEYVDRYLARTGLPMDDWDFYEVFGLFRLGVIAQQIWYRYVRGETTNERFAQFGAGVTVLVDRARGLTR
jgi:aminoglycoside phosphotransferase (APT) family kinase protein